MLSYERSLVPSNKGMEMKDERVIILPQDIIIEILKRLPVKSLIRFQSVCKLWNNLIKSSSFISTHLHYSAHNKPFLLIGQTPYRHNSQILLSLDSNMKIVVQMPIWKPLTDSRRHDVELIGSCNGLFFVQEVYVDVDDVYDTYNVYSYSHILWNPATGEVRQVPGSKSFLAGIIPNFGFGFSSIPNDYKLVGFYKTNNIHGRDHHEVCGVKNHVYYVEVYSLRRRSWKAIEPGVLNTVRNLTHMQAVIYNGTMFWVGVVDQPNLHMVVSFDIAMEVFSLIPIPSSITPHSDSDLKLTVYEDKLAMFWHKNIGNDDSCFFDLWVMEEDSGMPGKSWSWTKKFSIGPRLNWLYPLCIWRNEIICTNKKDADQVKHGTNLFLSLFNPTTNEWMSRNFTDRVNYNGNIFTYVESLVCLQHP